MPPDPKPKVLLEQANQKLREADVAVSNAVTSIQLVLNNTGAVSEVTRRSGTEKLHETKKAVTASLGVLRAVLDTAIREEQATPPAATLAPASISGVLTKPTATLENSPMLGTNEIKRSSSYTWRYLILSGF
jgi:hypothetical protein